MYGPRSSYDSQTLAEWDERVKDTYFADRLIKALQRPDVLEALAKAIQKAHIEETKRVGRNS